MAAEFNRLRAFEHDVRECLREQIGYIGPPEVFHLKAALLQWITEVRPVTGPTGEIMGSRIVDLTEALVAIEGCEGNTWCPRCRARMETLFGLRRPSRVRLWLRRLFRH